MPCSPGHTSRETTIESKQATQRNSRIPGQSWYDDGVMFCFVSSFATPPCCVRLHARLRLVSVSVSVTLHCCSVLHTYLPTYGLDALKILFPSHMRAAGCSYLALSSLSYTTYIPTSTHPLVGDVDPSMGFLLLDLESFVSGVALLGLFCSHMPGWPLGPMDLLAFSLSGHVSIYIQAIRGVLAGLHKSSLGALGVSQKKINKALGLCFFPFSFYCSYFTLPRPFRVG